MFILLVRPIRIEVASDSYISILGDNKVSFLSPYTFILALGPTDCLYVVYTDSSTMLILFKSSINTYLVAF